MYFESHIRLPTDARTKVGMATICVWCCGIIRDEFFIGAFRTVDGEALLNVMLHEACFDQIEDEHKKTIYEDAKIIQSFPSRIDSIE